MIKIEQLRRQQQQRLVPALQSWNEAKEQLEKSIALAESREREFRAVSEDVQRKLEALDVVIAMAKELGNGAPAEFGPDASGNKPMLMLPEKANGERKATEAAVQVRSTEPHSRGLASLLRASSLAGSLRVSSLAGSLRISSRPLFPSLQRSRHSVLSILP